MDNRLTLHLSETFFELLRSAWQAGEKVHLLVDNNGIGRAEGIIKQLDTHTGIVELENEVRVELNQVVAVNGIFRPEYGEC